MRRSSAVTGMAEAKNTRGESELAVAETGLLWRLEIIAVSTESFFQVGRVVKVCTNTGGNGVIGGSGIATRAGGCC